MNFVFIKSVIGVFYSRSFSSQSHMALGLVTVCLKTTLWQQAGFLTKISSLHLRLPPPLHHKIIVSFELKGTLKDHLPLCNE